MTETHALGRHGEDLAVRYLERRGWQVVARNVRTPYGEIDLIAREGEVYVFVEVKTRRAQAFGWPEEAVTPAKLRRLYAAALHWLQESSLPHLPTWRIDVVAVLMARQGVPQIRHFEGVYTGDDAPLV